MKLILSIIMFALVIIVINFGGHLFLYFSFLKFFQVNTLRVKLILGISLGLLSLAYIAGSALAHYADNVFTRGFYTLSASWLGVFAYLFMFFVLLWIVFGVCRVFHIAFPSRVLGTIFLLSAIGVSIYGFWNAANPRIVEVDVSIKNLPDNWKGKTIVQLSDVHLGHTLRQGFLWNIIDKVNSAKPEIVLITGDLFDGMDGSLSHLVEPFRDMHAPKGIYYVTGNHETYLGVDKAIETFSGTKIQFLNDESREVEGLQVLGVAYPNRGVKKDVAQTIKGMKNFNPKKPSILLWHTPTTVPEIAATGVSLMLAGHTHLGQIYPFRYLTHAVFSGYDYGLSRIGDFSLYTSSGVGTWGPPMRVGTIPEIVVIHLK